MYIAGTEALAGLQLLVAVAKADSPLTTDERGIIAEALEHAHLPDGITARALIESSSDIDALIAQIASQDARDVAFGACVTMANANRVCLPRQKAILDRIEHAWAVPAEKKGFALRVIEEARIEWLTPLLPEADSAARDTLVEDHILRYAVLAAVLGLDARPLESIATDLAVVGLQARMFRAIGPYWGRSTSMETVKQVIAAVGVGTGARVAVIGLVKFVPGAGSAFVASTNFASTWALGQVANLYWGDGGTSDLGTADLTVLRDAFERAKVEGRRLYEEHRTNVERKHTDHVGRIEELAAQCKAGEITLADYERKVVELEWSPSAFEVQDVSVMRLEPARTKVSA